MSRPSDPSARRPLETSEKVLAAAAVITLIIALLQLTSVAPLPHWLDDFVGGMAVGLLFGVVINLMLRLRGGGDG
jgi:xanthine/uracil permease